MNARMPRDMEDTDVMMVVVCCEGRSVRSVLWIEEVVSFEDIGGVLGLGGREDMKVGVGVLTGRRREGSIRQKKIPFVRCIYFIHSPLRQVSVSISISIINCQSPAPYPFNSPISQHWTVKPHYS